MGAEAAVDGCGRGDRVGAFGVVGTSSYGDQLPYVENSAALVAQQVPGIDAILVGHAHVEIPELKVTNKKTGKTVVLSEPLECGQRLSLFDFELVFEKGRWSVESVAATVPNSNSVAEDPRITRLLKDEHDVVVAYVNQVIGTATETLTTAEARYKDAPIIDLITNVQEDVVKAALVGTEYASLPVLSQASSFSRTSEIPAGEVTIRDLSGLYVYDNTLVARLMTGAQVRAYLEYSAQYFVQTAAGARGGRGEADERGQPAGLQLRLRVGSDVRHRHRAGGGVADQEAVLQRCGVGRRAAVRVRGEQLPGQGGGAFPHVASAKELWAESTRSVRGSRSG